MSDLWLAQYLCQHRHCLVAMAYDRTTHTPEHVETAITAEMTRRGIRPLCALCDSRDLHVEHARLQLQDWDAALRQLRAVEADNLRARQLIDLARNARN
jgi:hypothetical protein